MQNHASILQAYSRHGTAFPTFWQQTRAIRRYTDATWRIVPGVGRAQANSWESQEPFRLLKLQTLAGNDA